MVRLRPLYWNCNTLWLIFYREVVYQLLSLFIIDDEPMVCELIKSLIDFDGLQIELNGVFQNGVDALEKILAEKPDIVITDIKMPGISGLEMIKKCRENNIKSHFIIVSGYQEFEYAKQAIEYKADEYLLKPIKKSELNRLLKKIQEELVRSHNDAEETDKNRKRFAINKKNLWNKSLILQRRDPYYTWEMHLTDFFGSEITALGGTVFAAVLKLDITGDDGVLVHMETLSERIYNEIDAIMADIGCKLYTYRDESIAWVVAKASVGQYEEVKKRISLIIQRHKRQIHNVQLTAGMSDLMPYEAVGSAMGQAENMMLSRIFLGTNQVILPHSLNDNFSDKEQMPDKGRLREFDHYVRSLQETPLIKWIDEFFQDYAKKRAYSPLNRCVEMYIHCIDFMGEEISAANTAESLSVLKFWKSMLNSMSIEKMKERFCEKILDIVAEIKDYHRTRETKPIKQAKEYIQRNYNKEISLAKVAGHVHLTQTYFSVMFKRETGMLFSDYLLEVRINAAKILLETTNLGIADIAYRVGYSDARYFSKLFIKEVGIRPKEYRKLHS